MVKEIWFDMDGTIADLYGVADWLPKLRAEDETPYREARPLVRMQSLARVLNRLQREGYTIGVVSWLSIGSSEDYDNRVANAKREWLARHLASVKFDRIDIIPHGTPKNEGRGGYLFDDEERNRKAWNGIAYDELHILTHLKRL